MIFCVRLGKSRNDDLAAREICGTHLAQFLGRSCCGGMVAVAVGAFADDRIRAPGNASGSFRIANPAGGVAGEREPLAVRWPFFEHDAGRTEDVSGVVEARAQAGSTSNIRDSSPARA